MNLERFVDAQAAVYRQALAEIRAGQKRTHWMWFVLPQLGLGTSEMSRRYAIADLAEARAYLAHSLLGARLRECVLAILAHGTADILGGVDAVKLRSCLTLFEAAGGAELFAAALDVLYRGQRCENTKALLYGSSE